MNRIQRVVVILYCLSLVYCCLWVPWHVPYGPRHKHLGYGWIWEGPATSPADPDWRQLEHKYASPDVLRIVLRVIAASSLAAAAMLVAGVGIRRPARRD